MAIFIRFQFTFIAGNVGIEKSQVTVKDLETGEVKTVNTTSNNDDLGNQDTLFGFNIGININVGVATTSEVVTEPGSTTVSGDAGVVSIAATVAEGDNGKKEGAIEVGAGLSLGASKTTTTETEEANLCNEPDVANC